MLRFAVLQHEPPASGGRVHWDLLLEQSASLRTWALESPPDRRGVIAASSLPDHRKVYLTYEGPISANRGSVTQWDAGTYVLLNESDERVEIQMAGDRMRGSACLVRTSAVDTRWTFEFQPS